MSLYCMPIVLPPESHKTDDTHCLLPNVMHRTLMDYIIFSCRSEIWGHTWIFLVNASQLGRRQTTWDSYEESGTVWRFSLACITYWPFQETYTITTLKFVIIHHIWKGNHVSVFPTNALTFHRPILVLCVKYCTGHVWLLFINTCAILSFPVRLQVFLHDCLGRCD